MQLWNPIADRFVAGKRLRPAKRRVFVAVASQLEAKGVDPAMILLWMQVILALLEAAKPLLARAAEIVAAIRAALKEDKTPAEFAAEHGLEL